MSKAAELFSRYYPFTILGTPAAAGLFLVLGNSFATGNPYGYLISISGLTLIILLAIATRIQAARVDDDQLVWHTRHRLFAGKGAAPHTLEAGRVRILPFFRLRFFLSGHLRQEDKIISHHFQTTRFRPRKEEPFPLAIPQCGTFHAALTCTIEDIFGLTRSRCGSVQTRNLPVQPGIINQPLKYRVAERGSEEKDRMKESDVERYYMREYVPGDRFRDINWKSSGRGGKLYTRISPMAQEETVTVSLCIRLYAPDTHTDPGLLILGDYLKSSIMSFILDVTETHPDFKLEIYLNSTRLILENDQDIENFAVILGDTYFHKPVSVIPELPPEGRVYLFALPPDKGISRLYQAFPKTEFILHSACVAEKTDTKNGTSINRSLFPGFKGEDLPSLRLLARTFRSRSGLKRKLSSGKNVQPLRISMFNGGTE